MTLDDAIRRGQEAGLDLEDTVAKAWELAILRVANGAVARFRRTAVVAAANVDQWVMPDGTELVPESIADATFAAATTKARQRVAQTVIGETLAAIDVAWDVQNPFAIGVLEAQGGTKITGEAQMLRSEIMRVVEEEWQKGSSVPNTAKALSQAVPMISRKRATVIARTEVRGVTNGASLASVQMANHSALDAGEDPVARYKTWLATHDDRTRPTHQDADGQRVPVDQPFNVGGAALMYPGDQAGPPEEVVNCRCTLTFGDEPAITAAADGEVAWSATLVVEGVETDDLRLISPGALTWRDLPLTLGAQLNTLHGMPSESFVAGRIDAISRAPGGEIVASGIFSADENGQRVADLVRDKTVRGISIDIAIEEARYLVKDTGKEPETEDEWWEETLVFVVDQGVIMAATVVPIPSFREATIEVELDTSPDDAVVASSARIVAAFDLGEVDAITAGLTPLHPPAAWFENPNLSGPTAITVDDDGRVYGHAAIWGTCHTGFPSRCVQPPQGVNYGMFHLGEVVCDDATRVAVGQITLATGHADLNLDAKSSAAHYDHTGTALVDVVVGEDAHGLWVAGAVRPDAPEERIRELRAAKLSGDWRWLGDSYCLVGLLAVNVPGFPVPRAASGLVREDDHLRQVAIVAAGITPQTASEIARQRIGVLAAVATKGRQGVVDELAARVT